jgi:drug/metabolite transporter (DMT)-like permease
LFLPVTGLVLLALRSTASEDSAWDYWAAGEVVVMGILTWAAYRLWDVAMRKTDVTFVANCAYATPFLSTAFTCLYFHESATYQLWIGCGLIIAGSWLSSKSVSNRKPVEPYKGNYR